MVKEVYMRLCDTMAKLGGLYPGVDIPEFYQVVLELFSEEEAQIYNVFPRGFNSAETIAGAMGKPREEMASILEAMAVKGLCVSIKKEESTSYKALPFVPGIFERQFMRGTFTERDKKMACVIQAYKDAYAEMKGPPRADFPLTRVIAVEKVIKAGTRIHTYDQVESYIEKYSPLAVTNCYCRHQARLLDPNGYCGKPVEVCMQFGIGAQYVIDRGMGRKVSKEDAYEILRCAEDHALVHCSSNHQEIEWLCNCCPCHCMLLKNARIQPKPGLALNSGFQPAWDSGLCTGCEVCIDRCPVDALTMSADGALRMDPDRCIGCGVCATGCQDGAIEMEARPGIPAPPVDRKALSAAFKAE